MDTVEQVVVQFIADNATYLQGVRQAQHALHSFAKAAETYISQLETSMARLPQIMGQFNQEIKNADNALKQHMRSQDRIAVLTEKQRLATLGLANEEVRLSQVRARGANEYAKYSAMNQRSAAQESTAVARVLASENDRAAKETQHTAQYLRSENQKEAVLGRVKLAQDILNNSTLDGGQKVLALQGLQNQNSAKTLDYLYKMSLVQAYNNTLTNESLTGTQKLAAIMTLYGQSINKVEQQTSSLHGATSRFHKQASSEAMMMFKHYMNFGSQLGFLARQYVSLFAIVTAVKKVMQTGFNFNKFKEETTLAFSVMMKSAEAAENQMKKLFDFAVKSPLTFKETAQGARELMAYGFQAYELVYTMKMLGTVGKAVGASLSDMSYVYGTLKSQNRAYSRDLLQFAMRGIPIYEELAEVMHKPLDSIQKLASEGKVTFREVEKAFENMTQKGGKFAGLIDQYMTTFAGKFSMLKDLFEQNMGILTQGMFEQLKPIIDELIVLMQSPEMAQVLKQVATDLVNVIRMLVVLAKEILANYKLISTMLKLFVSFKISSGIVSSLVGLAGNFAGIARLAPGVAGGLTAVTGAATGLKLALSSTGIGGLIVGLTAIIALIPTVVRKMGELRIATNKKVAEDPAFRKATVIASASSILNPLQRENVFPEQLNKRPLKDYVAVIEDIAERYGVVKKEVADILVTEKLISDQIYKQLQIKYPDMFTVPKTPEAIPPPRDVDVPSIVSWMQERMGLGLPQVADIYSENKTYEGQVIKVITKYGLMGERAANAYIDSLKATIADEEAMALAIGTPFKHDDYIAAYEKQIKDLTLLLSEAKREGLDFNSTKFDEVISGHLQKLQKELQARKDAIALDKFEEDRRKKEQQAYIEWEEQLLGIDIAKAQIQAKAEYFQYMEESEHNLAQEKFKYMEDELGLIEYNREVAIQAVEDLMYLDDEYKKKKIARLNEEFDWQKKLAKEERARADAQRIFNLGVSDLYYENLSASLAKKLGLRMNAYGSGTNNAARGLAIVGETGPEIVQMQGGEKVYTNQESKQMVKSKDAWKEKVQPILDIIKSRVRDEFKWVIGPGLVEDIIDPEKLDTLLAAYNGAPDLQRFFAYNGTAPFTNSASPRKYGDIIASQAYKELSQRYGEKFTALRGGMEAQETYLPGTLNFLNVLAQAIKKQKYSDQLLDPRLKWNIFSFENPIYAMIKEKQQWVDDWTKTGYEWRKYATGTEFAQRGVALVGENGPELVQMHGGETVVSNKNLFRDVPDVEQFKWVTNMFNALAKLEGPASKLTDIFGDWTKSFVAQKTEVGSFFGMIDEGKQKIEKRAMAMYERGDSLEDVAGFMMSNKNAPVQDALTSTLGTLMGSLGGMIGSLSTVNEIMNPLTTMLQGFMEVVGPAVELALKPFSYILKSIGKVAGALVLPAIRLLGKAFGYVSDVAIGLVNGIIWVINGMISIVNMLPFVEMPLLSYIKTVKEAQEAEQSFANGQQSLTDTIEYLNNKLQKEVDKQIKTYEDMYSIGLMTASQYEQQVTTLSKLLPGNNDLVADADLALSNISDIATRLAELMALQQDLEDTNNFYTDEEKLKLLEAAGLQTTSAQAAERYLSNIQDILAQIAGFNPPAQATGTANVPNDMTALIHKGEIIMPRPFAESLRDGSLTLSKDGQNAGTQYNVTVNVAGSVTAERDLAVKIASEIRRQTVRGYAS